MSDQAARLFATDPAENVVLEASAGTGKTSVLVDRYIRLLEAGVNPANVLAITFTRKAAAEMRDRIVAKLRSAAASGQIGRARWQELRDRLGEIAVSTIDAFCLSLLREFPLEADLDPGFSMADEAEAARLIEEALDRTLRAAGALAHEDGDVAMVLARLGIPRARAGLAHLLEHRLVAPTALDRYLASGPSTLTADGICQRALADLRGVLEGAPGGLESFLMDGPLGDPRYAMLAHDLRTLDAGAGGPSTALRTGAAIRSLLDRVREHFFTKEGQPRQRRAYSQADCRSAAASERHHALIGQLASAVGRILDSFDRDLNVVLARGVRRLFGIALDQYRRTLEAHAVIDFSEALLRALDLLQQMDEFAQSRYRLESRYHHVLVDEFQDTSRAQWKLVALLIQSWGEGFGLVQEGPLPPSIFIVGDRKQSIYRFRDADVAVLEEAARFIEKLRPGAQPRRWISHSFRAVPPLLAFVNDLFDEVDKIERLEQVDRRDDAFRFDERDRFPVDGGDQAAHDGPVLGLASGETPEACADAIAGEIVRLLEEGATVRDRSTGVPRRVRPGDVAILFRSRETHREVERALEARGVPVYVYKGLGFFDADEVKDVCALVRFLAQPGSNLRAAAFLRSRFVRLTDAGLQALAPDLAAAITDADERPQMARLGQEDRAVLFVLRQSIGRWLADVDRVPPADLIDRVLAESAYDYELRGPRLPQARENLKKLGGLMRRVQNRGFATMSRVAEHLDRLSAGDEPNAVVDALDAVSLMTVHAAKGLEFPVVFLVNLAKGTGGIPAPIRVAPSGTGDEPVVSIGNFQSEADREERPREVEETKRLLYVALTRARDRLYLSSVLKDGQLKPARGSLAEVLPASLAQLFSLAARGAAEDTTITWHTALATAHVFRVCRQLQMGN